MKTIYLFIFICSLLFSQEWKETGEILLDYSHTAYTDSMYFDADTGLVIWGLETFQIFIPLKDSRGSMRISFIGTNYLGGADTFLVDLGYHLGDGDAAKSGWTMAYQRIDSVLMADGASGQLDVYPMANAVLAAGFGNFWDLKITGADLGKSALYIKIEWMVAP